jgi:hypothetical protein
MSKNKTVIIDEVHLTFRVPGDLPDDQAGAIRDALAGDEFMSRLRRAVRVVIREFPELRAVRAAPSR